MTKRWHYSRWVALLWAVLIFVTSSFFIDSDTFVHFMQRLLPNPTLQEGFARFWTGYGLFVVKGWHATEYAILALLGVAMLRRGFGWSAKAAISVAFVVAVLYAASDEWHQTFVPGRDGCVRDVVIDSAGALIAVTGLAVRERRRTKRAVAREAITGG